MRTITPTERALLGGSALGFHVKLLVANASGTLIDLSTWVVDGSIEMSVDAPVSSLSLSLKREDGALSLAPLLSTSTLNRNNGGTYAPLLEVARRIQLWTAVTALGTAPVTADWKQMFEGLIDTHDASAANIKVAARDLGAILLDTQIQQAISYGSVAGDAVETVMQQIIRDNVLASPPSLVVPISPNWLITPYLQDTTNVFDAIRALALQIGWDVRYVWSGTAFNLTLYDPNRTKTTINATVPPTEYLDVTELAVDRSGIRNIIEIEFSDSAAGGARTTAVFRDDPSIAQYGEQYMSIGLDSASNVNTGAEVTIMGAAALADLSTPALAHGIETLYWWPAQLGDLYTFSANSVHYDAAQSLAVIGVSHSFTGTGKARTVIKCKGKPVGAYAYWLTRPSIRTAGATPAPELLFVDAGELYENAAFVGWRIVGLADTDSSAVVITATPGLTIDDTVPGYTHAIGPVGEDEWWIPLDSSGRFTIKVLQPHGGSDVLTLTPDDLFNPSATIPRTGTQGKPFVLTLSRQPVTVMTVERVTATRFSVTLTVAPKTAAIYWRLDETGSFNSETNTSGSLTIGDGSLENPFLDVSSVARVIEYYGVSDSGVVEPLHRKQLDQNDLPSGMISLSEPTPSIMAIDAALDDDVVDWGLWLARNGAPTDASGALDDQFKVGLFSRDKQSVREPAFGDGGSTSTWHVTARFYDKSGNFDEKSQTILMLGTGGTSSDPSTIALTDLSMVYESGGPNIRISWTPSDSLASQGSGIWFVSVFINGVEKTPTTSIVDAQDGTWAWTGVAMVPAGTPGATAITYTATVLLTLIAWPGPPPIIPIGVYSISLSGFVAGPDDPTLPAPPSSGIGSTPVTPAVTAGAAGTGYATATFAPVTPGLAVEIEWYVDDAGFTTTGTLVQDVVLPAGTITHRATSLPFTQDARCRCRYHNSVGDGPWSGWSNSVTIASRGGFV